MNREETSRIQRDYQHHFNRNVAEYCGNPIRIEADSTGTIVSDIVYNPLKTTFLQKAEENGAMIHQGLGMFVYQGAIAFELFTGHEAPIDMMREAVLNHLKRD